MSEPYECDYCGQLTMKLFKTDENDEVCKECFKEFDRQAGYAMGAELDMERDQEEELISGQVWENRNGKTI